ncbi:MAG: hypothetical protein KAV87_42865 [Desulfobacteraceae bacterium]|nr:hypothetical protein [Desulfobacteraceae bacterium]
MPLSFVNSDRYVMKKHIIGKILANNGSTRLQTAWRFLKDVPRKTLIAV